MKRRAGLDPLQFVFQLPEGLSVDEGDASELRHHLFDGRLGDRADVGNGIAVIALKLVHLTSQLCRYPRLN